MTRIDIILLSSERSNKEKKKPTSPLGELNGPVKRRGIRFTQGYYVPSLVEMEQF